MTRRDASETGYYVDPGSMTQNEMHSREPIPELGPTCGNCGEQLTPDGERLVCGGCGVVRIEGDSEPSDRANCQECDGDGETINHNLLTGEQTPQKCAACLGTGTERTRDELADAFEPSEADLEWLNGPQ